MFLEILVIEVILLETYVSLDPKPYRSFGNWLLSIYNDKEPHPLTKSAPEVHSPKE